MIDFLPDTDQLALVNSVKDFLGNEMPLERLRPKPGSAEISPQPDRWREFADMGWFGIGLAEDHGGIGLGLAEEVLVFRELGRYLVSPAVLGAVLVARIAASHDADLCAAIVSGQRRVGLAHAAGTSAHYLVDAAHADLLLRFDHDGLDLFAADAFTDRAVVPALDGALSLERSNLSGAALCATSDPSLVRTARILASAMLVGGAETSLKLAVDYSLLREQFGQLIGKFQAIKHLCADMAVRAEAAWSQTVLAALSAHGQLAGAGFETAAAELLARSAAVDIAEQCIQIHGGMGFIVECDAHHFLKRAHLLVKLLGGVRATQTRLLAEPLPA